MLNNILNPRPNLKIAAANLTQYGVSPELRNGFVSFLESAKDVELFHLNPRYLADHLGLNERAALKLLVAAVHEGLVKLHWDVRCPVCGSYNHRGDSLHDMKHDGQCAMCQAVFAQRLDHEVRVTFSLHPRLRQLPPSANDKNWRMEVDNRFGPTPGHSLLVLPEFQKLFPQEKLLPDESLEVTRTALIFTDLAGSTALYAARGDPRAYHLVRLHFDVLFDAADRCGGTVVKNIGDAIMAVFQTPVEALRAGLAMQTGIADLNGQRNLTEPEALILKVGLHSGPCLSVTLNDRPDYFGTTVNVAARVQGLSRGHDVVFTEVIRRDAEAGELLKGKSLEAMPTTIKGLEGEWLVHRLDVQG
jgi:class 3 adenylate cyclase